MDAKVELQKYKKIVDRKLAEYFAEKIREAKKIDSLAVQAAKNIRDLTLAGGKRLRAAFMYWGYIAVGGSEIEKIIEASMSIELTHIFLLIHDDIIDRDSFRHGVPTMHNVYEKMARKLYFKKDPKHFGDSMAMIVGDMAAAAGNEIIFNSRFTPEKILKALDKLQNIVSETVTGEMTDVVLEMRGKASEKEILRVHKNKTAKYTIEGPLHLGALLAGAEGKILEDLSAYAVPVGIAFQIQDDILGVFGSEKKLGKPVCSDLREGKQTLLIVKALEMGTSGDRNLIKKLLGNKKTTAAEIEDFRNIIRKTGSLDYSRNLAKKFVDRGKQALQKSVIKKEAKDFMIGIADYIVNREV
jgi:geranylgeranyl diphosphate synthase type I